jgi:uncharacterized protein
MSIESELETELKDAMRSGDKARRDVIRQVRSEVGVARTAPGFSGETGDDLYRSVIEAYVKKMSKSLDEYRGLGDQGAAMAARLAYEVDYLSRWIPSKLGEDETRALVDEAIRELGVEGDPKASGRVIGHVMKSHKDEVDGGSVNRLVRQALGG